MWYYVRSGNKLGPVSWQELRRLASVQSVQPADMLLRQGLSSWQPAASLLGLFPEAPAARAAIPLPGRSGADGLAVHQASARPRQPHGVRPAATPLWRRRRVVIGCATACACLVLLAWATLADRTPPSAPPVAAYRKPADQPVKAPPSAPRLAAHDAPAVRPVLSTEEIARISEQSVALVRCQKGTGTGFLVRPGILATNAHVLRISPIDQYQIYFPAAGPVGKQALVARHLLYEDTKRDLALLAVDSSLPPLPLAEHYEFRRGQDVTVIGNPRVGRGTLTLETAVSRGVMSTQARIGDRDFYQLSIAINPGNSGGPAFDPTGQVIGVITLKAKTEEGIAFCVPVKDLQTAIATAQAQSPEDAVRATRHHDLRVVFVRLAKAGALYSRAMGVFTAGMAPRSVDEGIAAARRIVDETLRNDSTVLLDDIRSKVEELGRNHRIGETTRQQLAELWTTYTEMKSSIYNPRGTLEEYQAKTGELTDRHRRLVEDLKLALGVEDLD
jgi:S1-C subfamily serine protease